MKYITWGCHFELKNPFDSKLMDLFEHKVSWTLHSDNSFHLGHIVCPRRLQEHNWGCKQDTNTGDNILLPLKQNNYNHVHFLLVRNLDFLMEIVNFFFISIRICNQFTHTSVGNIFIAWFFFKLFLFTFAALIQTFDAIFIHA